MAKVKAPPAPVYFEAGEFADVECVNGAGLTVHVYNGDRNTWVCSHCGGEARPATPPEAKRPQEADEQQQWRPPTQPTHVRVRLANGESFTFPLTSEGGYSVRVDPLGGHGQAVGHAAHEVRELKFVFPKEEL